MHARQRHQPYISRQILLITTCSKRVHPHNDGGDTSELHLVKSELERGHGARGLFKDILQTLVSAQQLQTDRYVGAHDKSKVLQVTDEVGTGLGKRLQGGKSHAAMECQLPLWRLCVYACRKGVLRLTRE